MEGPNGEVVTVTLRAFARDEGLDIRTTRLGDRVEVVDGVSGLKRDVGLGVIQYFDQSLEGGIGFPDTAKRFGSNDLHGWRSVFQGAS